MTRDHGRKIPPAFWSKMKFTEFLATEGELNAQQCAKLWTTAGYPGDPPNKAFFELSRRDVKALLPEVSGGVAVPTTDPGGLIKSDGFRHIHFRGDAPPQILPHDLPIAELVLFDAIRQGRITTRIRPLQRARRRR